MSMKAITEKLLRRRFVSPLGALALLLVPLLIGSYFVLINLFDIRTPEADHSDPLSMCIEHGDLRTHIHATFIPILDRNPRPLPGGIGISADCLRPLHTHDSDFVVHIESPEETAWTVGDFFRVWGDESPYQGLGTNSISVNGERYEGNYQNIVFEDGLRLIIDFASR